MGACCSIKTETKIQTFDFVKERESPNSPLEGGVSVKTKTFSSIHGKVYEKRLTKNYVGLEVQTDKYGNRCFNEYTQLKSIGSGRYAQVLLCVNVLTDELFAVKECNRSRLSKAKNILPEVQVLKTVNHRNVVKMHEVIDCLDQRCVYLILEYVAGGALMHVSESGLADRLPINEEKCRHYMTQITSGLTYLHSQQIVHRDIKPDNILVCEDGQTVKLADFGVSQIFSTENETNHVRTSQGTPMYFAPEICNGQYYCAKLVDIWALGITLYIMLTGSSPFAGSPGMQIYMDIQFKEIRIPKTVSDTLQDLLERMLERNVLHRINMNEITHHPWITGSGVSVSDVNELRSNGSDSPTGSNQKKSPLGVLIVEENSISRAAMYNMTVALMKPPHSSRIDTLFEGNLAISAYKAWPYKIVLLNVHLSSFGGKYITGKIRLHESVHNIPKATIIGLVNEFYTSDTDNCLSLGMDSVLKKPVQPSILRDAFMLSGLSIHRSISSQFSNVLFPVKTNDPLVDHVANSQYVNFLKNTEGIENDNIVESEKTLYKNVLDNDPSNKYNNMSKVENE